MLIPQRRRGTYCIRSDFSRELLTFATKVAPANHRNSLRLCGENKQECLAYLAPWRGDWTLIIATQCYIPNW